MKLPICSNLESVILLKHSNHLFICCCARQYKMTLILQSLALIDRGFSAPYINITSIQTSEHIMDREHQFHKPKT